MFGQQGNDLIRGGIDDDFIEGGPGSDTLFGDDDQDDIVGGSSAYDGVIDGVRDGEGTLDGQDVIEGGDDHDVITGDNAWLVRPEVGGFWTVDPGTSDRVTRHVFLWDSASDLAGSSGGDTIEAGDGLDRVFGQHGNDTIFGNGGDDYIEGGGGADIIEGNGGEDDITGGSSALDGVIDDDRTGTGMSDGPDTISGGPDSDVIAGDNARITRPLSADEWVIDPNQGGYVVRDVLLFDLSKVGAPAAVGTSGADAISGDAGREFIFGQGGNDFITGDDGSDYIEGNDGNDLIFGGDDEDDLIGGGSANDGAIGPGSIGALLHDGNDTIHGDAESDFITGDNSRLTRPVDGSGLWKVDVNAGTYFQRDVQLFDVNSPDTTVSGDDLITGDGSRDLIWGQAENDTVHGNDGDDYIEGNNGFDTIFGDDGDDDIVGGGSAITGLISDVSLGNGLFDDGDIIEGNAGTDVIAGDNARITRPGSPDSPWNVSHPLFPGSVERSIQLFDVDSLTSPAIPGTSGGDDISGNGSRDLLFGQGGDDSMSGDAGHDYVEGNHGSDLMTGDGDQDDLVGGSSAGDGLIFGGVAPEELLDGDDTIHGNGSYDVVAGDNAWVLVTYDGAGTWNTDPNTVPGAHVRNIVLFDVSKVISQVSPLVHGDDLITGDAGRDLLFGQGGNDEVHGGDFDDYIEGNAGADLLFGDGIHFGGAPSTSQGEDDITGGNGAGTSVVGGAQGSVYLSGVSPTNLADGSDEIHGGGEDDVIVGDNATITRPVDFAGLWIRLTGFGFDIVVRDVAMPDYPPSSSVAAEDPGAFGDDEVHAGDGHDDVYGQLGDDLIFGDDGEDALVGDLGMVTKNILGDGVNDAGFDLDALIDPEQPFFETTIFQEGQLFRLVELFHFETGNPNNGADILIGGNGDDWIHGGAGNDLANGNAGVDRMFGGDDDDAMWGGPDNDFLLGGHHADNLDVKPRTGVIIGPGGNAVEFNDPLEWFTYAGTDNYQGADFIYGGYDRDVMQANDNNSAIGPEPFPPMDRLVDWVGVYNLYLICEPLYGDWMITRALSPGMLAFLQDLATGMGALDVPDEGTSGFRELGLVFAGKDTKFNAGQAHPGSPGHFVCDDGELLTTGSAGGGSGSDSSEPPEPTDDPEPIATPPGNGKGKANGKK
jgi:Ca2+-binding RTX toxin-like protein